MKKKYSMGSFCAADELPIKLVSDAPLVHYISKEKRIPPIHAQFIPTNECNFNCAFCSCANDDRTTTMPIGTAREIINKLRDEGCEAVTITGGGEPLLYKDIVVLCWLFAVSGIQIGLVTNGSLLHGADAEEALKCVRWCRISNSDDRVLSPLYAKRLERVVADTPHIDWAFSHVISPSPNYGEIARVIDFANNNDFTHVRLVADLLRPESVDMHRVMEVLSDIDTSKVIFQARSTPQRGRDCYIGYLKPLIGADGMVYTCCGVQYAFNDMPLCLPKSLCLGDARHFEDITARSGTPFDGSICDRCYYTSYNVALKGMLSDITHKEFV